MINDLAAAAREIIESHALQQIYPRKMIEDILIQHLEGIDVWAWAHSDYDIICTLIQSDVWSSKEYVELQRHHPRMVLRHFVVREVKDEQGKETQA